jgi:hypothetical protein
LLLIVAPALIVALGFAQTPAASVNTDQTIKGCLAGSDGNYTVVEDGTGHIFKISAASVDFKQHLGHDVTLIGHKASGASSAAVDNSFVVTELNMISEHCAVAAAAPIAAIASPAETIAPPDAAAAARTIVTPAETSAIPVADATSPPATVTTPAETAIVPDGAATPPAETVVIAEAAVTPPSETTVTPAASAPAAAASTPWDKPAADAADATRLPARSRRLPATRDATAITPAVTDNTPAATASAPDPVAASPAATASSTPSETPGIPDAAATTPAAPARRGALGLLIALAVLVIVIGTLVPFISRWRKQKSLERTGAPNLSFTREASSDEGKGDQPRPRKAA